MQSPQACVSAGPSMQPLTWAAPFNAYAGQRHGASPATPAPSSSAAFSPVPMRSSHQPTMPFAASPALQVRVFLLALSNDAAPLHYLRRMAAMHLQQPLTMTGSALAIVSMAHPITT